MSFLFNLPDELVDMILSQWIGLLGDFVNLDTALCNHLVRQQFLKFLTDYSSSRMKLFAVNSSPASRFVICSDKVIHYSLQRKIQFSSIKIVDRWPLCKTSEPDRWRSFCEGVEKLTTSPSAKQSGDNLSLLHSCKDFIEVNELATSLNEEVLYLSVWTKTVVKQWPKLQKLHLKGNQHTKLRISSVEQNIRVGASISDLQYAQRVASKLFLPLYHMFQRLTVFELSGMNLSPVHLFTIFGEITMPLLEILTLDVVCIEEVRYDQNPMNILIEPLERRFQAIAATAMPRPRPIITHCFGNLDQLCGYFMQAEHLHHSMPNLRRMEGSILLYALLPLAGVSSLQSLHLECWDESAAMILQADSLCHIQLPTLRNVRELSIHVQGKKLLPWNLSVLLQNISMIERIEYSCDSKLLSNGYHGLIPAILARSEPLPYLHSLKMPEFITQSADELGLFSHHLAQIAPQLKNLNGLLPGQLKTHSTDVGLDWFALDGEASTEEDFMDFFTEEAL